MKKLFLFAAAVVGVAVPVAAGVNARAQKLDVPVPAPAPVVCVEEEIHSLQGVPTRARLEVEAVQAAAAPAQFHDIAFTAFGGGEDVRVNLDVKDATPREALKHVFDQTKLKHQVDEDVPDEPRLTVASKGIRLSTALSLIAEAAGVNWTIERRLSVKPAAPPPPGANAPRVPTGAYETSVLYRIGKKVSPARMFFGSPLPAVPTPAIEGLLGAGGTLNVLTRTREERSTFNCPHCKGQTTMVRVKERASCPKCSRVLQDDWQFCPADGVKRPAPPNEWRYCPICGKNVPAPEKAATK